MKRRDFFGKLLAGFAAISLLKRFNVGADELPLVELVEFQPPVVRVIQENMNIRVQTEWTYGDDQATCSLTIPKENFISEVES